MSDSERRLRVVITVAGSDTDGPQLVSGLKVVAQAVTSGKIEALDLSQRQIIGLDSVGVGHYTISVHRNPSTLYSFASMIAEVAKTKPDTDFVLVVAAGWLASLSGCLAGLLYYRFGAANVFVIGVGLESEPKQHMPYATAKSFSANSRVLDVFFDLGLVHRRNLAAILAQTEVPGNLMISTMHGAPFFGEQGFCLACETAVSAEIPEELRAKIANAKGKPPKFRTFEQAIAEFEAKAQAAS